MTTVLGIETSTLTGSIALRINGELKEERTLSQTGRRHAQTLVSEIENLLKDYQVPPSQCDRVAVSIGPGSFTGLRVGVVFAKLMAWSSGCELVPVDTLLAIAENSPDEIQKVTVITNAQRGDLFMNEYERDKNSHLKPLSQIRIVPGEEWAKNLTEDSCITGNGINIIQSHLPKPEIALPSDQWIPKASVVARLGEWGEPISDSNEIIALEPFYLRKSAAEEKKEQENSSPEFSN